MKTKFKIVVSLIIMTSCTNIIVKQVSTLKQPETPKHLISYFLPKRVFEIKFTVEHQVIEPSAFSKDSLALDSIILSATGKKMVKQKTHKLVLKQVELIPVTLADPDKLYSVDYRKAPFSKLEGNISISEYGFINSGSVSTESKAYQVIQTGLESIAGIVANIAGLAKSYTPFELKDKIKQSELTKKATFLLDKLDQIQTAKAEMKLSILKEQEEALVQQLTGEISKKEYLITRTWDPKLKEISTGKFKKSYDIEMSLGGTNKLKPNIHIILVASLNKDLFNLIPQPLIPVDNSKDKKIGFYYNIPVPMTIKVYKEEISDFTLLNFIVNSNKQSSITLQMPQFGPVHFLPARLTKSDVKFYSDLGSIKEYSFTKDISINPEEGKNVASSIDTVFSTINYFRSLKESVIEEKEVKSDESGLYNVNITITPLEN